MESETRMLRNRLERAKEELLKTKKELFLKEIYCETLESVISEMIDNEIEENSKADLIAVLGG